MAKKGKAPKKHGERSNVSGPHTGKKPEKPAEGAPKEKAPRKPAKEEKVEEGLRGIVRIAGKDMKGGIPLRRALLRVRGFSHTTSRVVADVVAKEAGINPEEKVGKFSDEQIEAIDKILSEVHKHGIPKYLLNRRKDTETGEDIHVIMNDLIFTLRQDVEREKKLYTWKGYRHAYGQKVRGQKTRNTGRKGMALGVLRKSLREQAAAAKSAGTGSAKGAVKEEKKK